MNFNPIRFGTTTPTQRAATPVVKFGNGETTLFKEDALLTVTNGITAVDKDSKYGPTFTADATLLVEADNGSPTVMVSNAYAGVHRKPVEVTREDLINKTKPAED
jgi:hypothetical protein